MKKFFFSTTPVKGINSMAVFSLLIRLVVGVSMLTHGTEKLMNFASLSSTFPDPINMGSMLSLIMAVGAEVGCSLLLIVGLLTRLAVLPLIFTMCMACFVVLGDATFATRELSVLYIGLYVAIFAIGAGRYSLDRVIFRK